MSITDAGRALVKDGDPHIVETASPKAAIGAVFEDDGDTGY
jgi:hypothetical protein